MFRCVDAIKLSTVRKFKFSSRKLQKVPFSSTVDSMCAMIPDYVDAASCFNSKKYKAAIPKYSRAYDILHNVMPSDDNAACHKIVHQITQCLLRSGNVHAASSYLKQHIDTTRFVSIEHSKNVQFYCSLGLLVDKNWTHWANILVNITQDAINTGATTDKAWTSLLQCDYSISGLLEISAAMQTAGDAHRNDRLDVALKMMQSALDHGPTASVSDTDIVDSQDAVARIAAIGIKNNMGFCNVLKCHHPVMFHPDDMVRVGDGDSDSDRVLESSPFYMDFFSKSIDDAYTFEDTGSLTTAEGQDQQREKLSDIGFLADGMIHWQDAVEQAEALNKDIAEEKIVLSMEETAQFITSYATILCNCAIVDAYVGRRMEANNHLSTAIRLLNVHINMYKGGDIVIDSAWQLLLAKVLTMTASAHLHGTQAITAEGLFRASMDAYKLCEHDHRCGFDKSITLYNYGKCLLKWEKREQLGAQYQEESKALLASVDTGTSLRPFPSNIIVPYVL